MRANWSVRDWQRLARFLLLALGLAVAVAVEWIGSDLPAVRQLEAHARDLAMVATASDEGDARIAVVDIDEPSLKRIGPWPWPRDRLADLAERLLSEGGARVVAFDIVLTEPANTAQGTLGDQRLAALAAQGWMVPAQAFDYIARQAPVTVGLVGGSATLPGDLARAKATGHVGSFTGLASGRCVGNIGIEPDPDGKVRRIAPWTQWQGQAYPAFALAAIGCARPALDLIALTRGLRTDARGSWAIPFRIEPESYQALPAAAVIEGELARAAAGIDRSVATRPGQRPLEGRIVLVGSSALGLADQAATPLASSVSGVSVHLAALSALLDLADGSGPPQPPAWAMTVWTLLSVGALWLVVASGAGFRWMTASALTALACWALLAGWTISAGGQAPVTGALWGYAVVLLLHLPAEWSWAHSRVRSRTRLLSRYVAPAVLGELLEKPDQDPLTPRKAEITVLIADMQEYTRLTNDSTLEDAARLTRGFLEQLTGPVLTHRGTLDRYTGDGLVAFWGAPVPVEGHAQRAVEAALAIVENVRTFNAARTARGEEPVRVRVGIASGQALVGDLGTPFRSAYTAVGDCINLASRLQQLTRELEVDIAVAGAAAALCPDSAFRSLGRIPVRGLPDQEVFTPEGPARATGPR
jgi:adenylate cyclase